jgi:hypothetical protein
VEHASNSGLVTVYVSKDIHSTAGRETTKSLNPESIEVIDKELALRPHATPLELEALLIAKQKTTLKIEQIANYKSRWQKKNVPQVNNAYELKEFCERNNLYPSDPDEMFCASYNFLPNGGLGNAFLTTPTLLELVKKRGDIVHVDGTYKTTWVDVVVVIPVITDFGNHAHPLGICIIEKETEYEYSLLLKGIKKAVHTYLDGMDWCPKVLVKDCADSIKNGFLLAFSTQNNITDIKTVDCWAHVSRNIKSRMNKDIADKTLLNELTRAIYFLQSLPTAEAFQNGLLLFF